MTVKSLSNSLNIYLMFVIPANNVINHDILNRQPPNEVVKTLTDLPWHYLVYIFVKTSSTIVANIPPPIIYLLYLLPLYLV